MFPEAILAWEHGPVVREVWDEYKFHGAKAIPPPDDESALPLDQAELLDELWGVYGQFSAWRLRDMTHETPPWSETARNAAIDPGAMMRYFKTQLA